MQIAVMDNKSLFVKNFANHYDEDNLKELFGLFGEISSVNIIKDTSNKSKGHGFINFKNQISVKNALALNGHIVKGTNLKLFVGLPKNQEKELQRVEKSQKYGAYGKDNLSEKSHCSNLSQIHSTSAYNDLKIDPRRVTTNSSEVNLFVNNLDPFITDSMLEELFSKKYRSVVKGRAKVMRNGHVSKGFGFVLFNSWYEAKNAIKTMNGQLLGSKYIEVSEKKERRNNSTGANLQLSDVHGNKNRFSEGSHFPNPLLSHFSSDDCRFPISVEQNVSRLPKQVNLFVNNLDPYVTDSILEDFFAQKYKSVATGKAKVMRNGPVSKGFGFVLFNSCSEAKDAIETMNGQLLGSKYIEVSEKKEKRNVSTDFQPIKKDVDKMVTKVVEMTSIKAAYITRHCITDKCVMNLIAWNIVEHPYSIEIKGLETVAQKAVDWLQHQKDSSDEVKHTIQKIGIPKYFRSELGKQFLKDTEEKLKCIIVVEDCKLDLPNKKVTIDKQVSFIPKRLKCDYKIGNIVDESSDVIVTTSSAGQFYTGCGSEISKQLLQSAGPNLAIECKEISKKCQLVPGTVVSTNGYNLKCKTIYHIILRNYVPGKSLKEQLQNSLKICLQMADSAGYHSISFPCVGTGGFGYPSDEVFTLFENLVSNSSFKNLTAIQIVVFQQDLDCLQELEKIQHSPVKYLEDSVNCDENNLKINCTEKEKPDQIQLNLCLNPNKKSEVLKYIGDYVNEKTLQLTISDEIISELSDQDEHQIMGLEEENDVKIKKLLNKFPPQFLIEGISTNVRTTNEKIQEMLNFDKLSRKLTWKIQLEDGQMHTVSKEENFTMENNYQLNKKSCSIKLLEKEYDIDFQTMIAQRKTKVFKIFRIKANEKFPAEWTNLGENRLNVVVPPETKEFKEVHSKFIHSGLHPVKIIKLERIQNKTLFQQFSAQKENILKSVHQPTQELFHGTNASVCDSIINNGFDRSYAGKNATAYGHGVYFAKMASYSDGYAKPDPQNTKRIFIAEVITGKYTVGNSSHKVIPNTPAGHPYDSLVDRITNPTIFVVFKDASVYPKYLLTYQ